MDEGKSVKVPTNDSNGTSGDEQESHKIQTKIESTKGLWVTYFSKNIRIKIILEESVQHFSFVPNGDYALYLDKDNKEISLDIDKKFGDYEVFDGVLITLVDKGSSAS